MLSQFPSMPDGSPRIWASDDVVGPGTEDMSSPYDDFVVSGSIGAVQWWGTEINISATPWMSGHRASNTFSITFFASDFTSGNAMPGAVVARYDSIVATKEATAVQYVNPYYLVDRLQLYRYYAELPVPLPAPGTTDPLWIHIRGTLPGSSNGVVFVQISAANGNEVMCVYDGVNLPYRRATGGRRDIAMCLVEAIPSMEVPNVVGMMQAEAEAAIIAAGLTVGVITNYFTDEFPAGQVLSQHPAGGAMAPQNSPVNLEVASTMAQVPNLVGLSLNDAKAALLNATLQLGSITRIFNDVVPENEVMFQSRAAGTMVPPNTVVSVTISRGPAQPLPMGGVGLMLLLGAALGVTGVLRHSRARNHMRVAILVLALALTPGLIEAQETCPSGSVFGQTPTLPNPPTPPGPRVWFSDDIVTPSASVPAPYDNFSVTDPIGAVQWWGVELSPLTGVPGARLANTFTIRFYANDTTTVPGVPMPGSIICEHVVTATKVSTGILYPNALVPAQPLTLHRYYAALPSSCVAGTGWINIRGTAAGSANGIAFMQLSSSVGGTTATKREFDGVNMPYRVRTGERRDMAFCLIKSVTVPSVVGQTQASAEAAIVAAELTVGAITFDFSGTYAPGTVASQSPAGASLALVGSPVNLVVAASPAGALISQAPTPPPLPGPRIWVSDDLIGPGSSAMPAPYDDFTAATPIGVVQWWGVEMTSWLPYVEGARAANTFTITFFSNDTSGVDPMPGAVVCQQVVTATKEATPYVYANPFVPGQTFTLRRYHAVLPTPCTLANGWISIRGTAAGSANGVLFVQVSSSVGNLGMREFHGALPYVVQTGDRRDMAFRLLQAATVPNVVGQTQASAEAAILAADLAVGAITHDYSGTYPAGQVVAQSPVGGAAAAPGSAVNLTVAANAPGVLMNQAPTPPPSHRVWISDDLTPPNPSMPAPYDDFTVTDPIGVVEWWGVEIDAGTFREGARAANEFTITFYSNDTSGVDPMPGAVVCQQVVEASKTSTAHVYPSPYEPGQTFTLQRYHAILPAPCVLANGWISIRGTAAGSANGVLFVQVSSSVGNQNMREFHGALPYVVRAGAHYDMAFQLTKAATAPHVVGLTQADAVSAIIAADLVVGTITYDYSGTYPVGQVLSQSPVGGSPAAPGSPVNIVVAATTPGALMSQPPTPPPAPRIWVSDDLIGPGNIAMPAPYDDFTVSVPIGVVEWWGIEMTSWTPNVEGTRAANEFTITFYNTDLSGVDPMPGTVACQHVVTATKEATAYVYPNSFAPGQTFTLQRYRAILPEACTLASGWISIRGTATGSANGILFVQTSSSAGNQNMREFDGTNLPYRVRTGERRDMTFQLLAAAPVPDVTGLSQAAAEAALVAAGFAVGTITYDYSGTGNVGDVIGQTPAAGAYAPPGSAVNLVVAAEPATQLVPNVIGMQQADAETAILAALLTVGTVTLDYSGVGVPGEVLEQAPAGGTYAVPGALVYLVVAGTPVIVPNLVGMTLEQAEAALVAAGLTVGVITEDNSATIPAGQVMSQNPAEGAPVAPGAVVDLVLSLGPVIVVPAAGIVGLLTAMAALGVLGAVWRRKR